MTGSLDIARAPGPPRRPARAMPTLPQAAWPDCTAAMLPQLLAGDGWSLVEFWAPDNLFGRLMLPVRVLFSGAPDERLRLLCCVAPGPGPECAAFGAIALPALVLFRGARRVRRWIGPTDASLVAFEVERALRHGAYGKEAPTDAPP